VPRRRMHARLNYIYWAPVARNGARRKQTAPPVHPTKAVAPWQRTDEIGCGALKHATERTASWC